MKRYISMLLLCALMLGLFGCGQKPGEETAAPTETTAEATIAATIPADGDPHDVTCKGSYCGEGEEDAVVAVVGAKELTNDALTAWYWAEVASYRQGDHAESPDFDLPLDTQACPIDDSVNSWQQYFLKKALDTWHAVQALTLQGEEEGLPTEEAYQPVVENHEQYMTGMPATKFLYGYNKVFAPNTMHQAWLDNIPQMLDDLAGETGYSSVFEMADIGFGGSRAALEDIVFQYNWAYSYFTNLSYDVEPTQEEIDSYFRESAGGYTEAEEYVTIRHMLIAPKDVVQEIPAWQKNAETEPVVLETVAVEEDGTVTGSDAAWQIARDEARELVEEWEKDLRTSENTFAEMARKHSDDSGTNVDGGLYRRIRKGQLMPLLDDWCFDESRQTGDTEILESQYGIHVLYFCEKETGAMIRAAEDLTVQRQREIIDTAVEKYPMEVSYSAIALSQGDGAISLNDILYPDVAHERFPEVPLYLQQDYQTTMYGAFPIRSYGCGITTFSMLASYLADEEYTPPEMCAAYGSYSFRSGTNGMLFNNEPSGLGFYLKEKTYDHRVAYKALEEGYVVVTLQHKGHWTRGGHYLLLEKALEGERVQVRDSNIYNYFRVKDHAIDSHKFSTIPDSADGFWIYEKKVTAIPACARCGDPEGLITSLVKEDYTCRKCETAQLRRNTFLAQCGG